MPLMYRTLGILLVGLFPVIVARTQDTLPSFTAASRGNGKVIISWHNNYPVVTQISIQRSSDSLKNFTTLITVQDPKLPENGAVDNKATAAAPFYRLFVVLENGKYLFTKAKRPPEFSNVPIGDNNDAAFRASTQQRVVYIEPGNKKDKPIISIPATVKPDQPVIDIKRTIFVKRGDSLIGQIPGDRLPRYRDSLLTRTKDTLIFIDGDSLLIKPFVPQEVYRISNYVYTGKYGNVQLSLPDATKKHYSVKFFDENNRFLFELTTVKDPALILDKTDFMHAGWFRFELYESGQLKEKNKFFIPKEF